MAVSVARVLVVVVSFLLITYVAFELLRPDVLLVGNVTIDVLQGGTRVGASPSSSRPGGVNDCERPACCISACTQFRY